MPITNLSDVSKKIIVTRLICFSWLTAKAISWKVWLADRLFPVVPPFNFPFVPSAIHLLLFIFSILTLCALFIFPAKRIFLVSLILIEVFSCSLDQNRWQPWEYQYIFIILALVINYKSEKNALSVIAFIFISTYFFSGVGKMNPVFSQSVMHKMTHLGIFHPGNSILYNVVVFHAGYFFGIIEILLSLGLLFQRAKKIAALFLIIMHLFILAILGPLGMDYDEIIWPWNVMMIIILYLLFLRNASVPILFPEIKKGWNKLIIIFFGILPVLNFFGYWDFFLSASLFSSRPPDMYICIHHPGSGEVLQRFPAGYKNKFLCDSTSTLLDVREWSFREMQVPPYPEVRIYKSIKKQMLKRYPDMDATFIVYRYSNGKKIRTELR